MCEGAPAFFVISTFPIQEIPLNKSKLHCFFSLVNPNHRCVPSCFLTPSYAVAAGKSRQIHNENVKIQRGKNKMVKLQWAQEEKGRVSEVARTAVVSAECPGRLLCFRLLLNVSRTHTHFTHTHTHFTHTATLTGCLIKFSCSAVVIHSLPHANLFKLKTTLQDGGVRSLSVKSLPGMSHFFYWTNGIGRNKVMTSLCITDLCQS